MLGETTHQRPGRDWSYNHMAVTEIVSKTTVIIDLDDPPTGHRLTELLRALTGPRATY